VYTLEAYFYLLLDLFAGSVHPRSLLASRPLLLEVFTPEVSLLADLIARRYPCWNAIGRRAYVLKIIRVVRFMYREACMLGTLNAVRSACLQTYVRDILVLEVLKTSFGNKYAQECQCAGNPTFWLACVPDFIARKLHMC
jgi:hypothetical protein